MRYFVLTWLLAVVACVPTGSGIADDDDPTARDVAEYEELRSRLEQRRAAFLDDEADALQAAPSRVYWLEYASFDPTVHSSRGGVRVDYGFPAGTEGNVRGSDQLVVTATRDGDQVYYRAYDAGQRASLRGELALPSPTDEQRWWAYAVDGGTVYIVTTGAQTTIHRWVPGAAPVVEVVLEERGVAVGIFLDVMVYRGRLLFIESGRLWTLDLATKTATWVGNKQQITGGVSVDPAGILYTAADGPHYHASGVTRAIADEIAATSYRLNATFANIHHYASHAVLHHGRVIYKGQGGMFAYELATRTVRPLLLEPRGGGLRVDYTDPQITDDTAMLYVTGLESESGAVGADGPVYAVDLRGSW